MATISISVYIFTQRNVAVTLRQLRAKEFGLPRQGGIPLIPVRAGWPKPDERVTEKWRETWRIDAEGRRPESGATLLNSQHLRKGSALRVTRPPSDPGRTGEMDRV
ncbi:hypothetical protein GCM10009835_17580 [Planosporangium flavigriseum]|uniref:Uncharacterized protein n=1 Tax=Planosporangium flavigriseum TaxID=373681 RepID=A0A8J3LN59_9ACTN|nr:hypothetical protein Pfl04_46420 [Planosporangium flavigriseum]